MLKEAIEKFCAVYKGGEGSGNFGHEGRPGEIGGSGSGGGSKHESAGLRNGLNQASAKIRSLSHEKLIVLNEDGTIHGEISGTANSISLTSEENASLSGRITLHNHPKAGMPFSPLDVCHGILSGEIESHVVGPNGETYKMSFRGLTGKSKDEREVFAKRIRREYPKIDKEESAKEWLAAPQAGRAQFSSESVKITMHKTWVRIAQKYGLEYTGDPKL